MKRIILCAVAAAILIAQPSLYAKDNDRKRVEKKNARQECMMKQGDNRGPGPCGPMFGDPERMKKDLGLTDEQVNTIAAINSEHRKKMLDFKEKMAPREIQLERLLLEDTVDLAKVKSLLKEISDMRVEIHMLMIQHRLDIEKVLTAEQKAKMKQHRKHMMDKRGLGPMGPGPGPEGPPERD